MKSLAKIINLIFIVFLASSCSQNEIQKKQVKSLDSLSGSINTLITSLQKPDSTALCNLLDLYDEYIQFINNKLIDTLTKAEAIELISFSECGELLLDYKQNESKLLKRLSLLNSQIANLSSDIQSKVVPSNESNIYFQNEIQEANRLTPLVFNLEKDFDKNFQKLSQSILKIEAIIKNHNNNQLPIIVTKSNNI